MSGQPLSSVISCALVSGLRPVPWLRPTVISPVKSGHSSTGEGGCRVFCCESWSDERQPLSSVISCVLVSGLHPAPWRRLTVISPVKSGHSSTDQGGCLVFGVRCMDSLSATTLKRRFVRTRVRLAPSAIAGTHGYFTGEIGSFEHWRRRLPGFLLRVLAR